MINRKRIRLGDLNVPAQIPDAAPVAPVAPVDRRNDRRRDEPSPVVAPATKPPVEDAPAPVAVEPKKRRAKRAAPVVAPVEAPHHPEVEAADSQPVPEDAPQAAVRSPVEVAKASNQHAEHVAKPPKPKRPAAARANPPTKHVESSPVVPRAIKPEDQVHVDEAYALPYDPPSFHFGVSDDPHVELATRELCRRKLLPFIQRFRPKYTAGWVHEDICRRIERFVRQVEAGESPRLLLMMPPRSGKSEISSRHTPAWILGQHPDWEIIAGSHTSSLSLSFSRYLRDVMRDPAYTAVFPDARLDPSSQSVENWNLTKGGGYLAAGVGTGITGRGAHVLLLDDLVKDIEAADSLTIRDNTWEWYLSTAYTRLAPGGGVLGLMTWWHADDWAGRIQEAMVADDGADKFEIIRYPAINEIGDEFILPDDSIQEFMRDIPPPAGSRLTRRHNTAVHPARYTTEMMLRIKHNLIGGGQKRVWDALYQQNPIPDEGNYFSKEMFKYYGTVPSRDELYVYQAWDFAISEGKESDYTVGTCIGVDPADNVYLLDQRRFRVQDGGFIVDEILDFAKLHDADLLGFEDGQIWKSIEFQFQKRCEERRQYPSFELLKPLTDKLVRANPLKGRMQIGKVYFDKTAAYFAPLMKEMLHFPAGKHDDQVDSLSWAVRLTLTKSAPRKKDYTPKVKSWKDKLAGFMSGAGASHMSA